MRPSCSRRTRRGGSRRISPSCRGCCVEADNEAGFDVRFVERKRGIYWTLIIQGFLSLWSRLIPNLSCVVRQKVIHRGTGGNIQAPGHLLPLCCPEAKGLDHDTAKNPH
jgi:hypothetical protein